VRIKISFQLPGTLKTIAATATIAYFVRGETESNATTITFGVSFDSIDYSDRDVIGEFISQSINSSTVKKDYHFPDEKMLDAKRESQIPCFA